MSKRAIVLLLTMGTVLLVAACGRASQDEINDLLGIQPTPTQSAEQIAQATEAAIAAASAQASGSTPEVAAVNDGEFDASAGDVTLGRQQFAFQCQQCHRADGAGKGPALAGPDNPSVELSDQEIATLVREGHGEAAAYSVTRLSDRQLASIIAFIRQQSE